MKQKKFHHVRNLVASMKPYSGEMLLTILCSFLKQASVIGMVSITAYMVGLAVEGELMKRFVPLLVGLIACILLRAALNYGEMWFGHDVAFCVIRNYRLALYKKISRLAPAYMMRESTGKLGQTLIGDVEVLELFLAHTFGNFVVAVVVTVIVMCVLFAISPLLGAILIPATLLIAVVPYSMKKRAASQGKDVRARLSESNSTMIEGIQGLREIITFNHQEEYKKKCLDGMQALYGAQQAYGRRKGMESLLTSATVGCFTVAVMVVAAGLVANGTINFSMYPVAVMLANVVLAPVMEVATVAQELGLVFAAATRIQTVLSETPAVADEGSETKVPRNCKVEFSNVNFGYPPGDEQVLSNVSFDINPGETVVLVGHSGAGKSTCANLLLRYWDVHCGNIRINGRDIRDYKMDTLRETISAVQQETYLFHASIRENIRLGRVDATDAEVENAARLANAHDFILSLPNGYDTIAGEHGYALSGGQRQRIAIARAILKDTPIVIFDEAVSSLDTENERDIQHTLKTRLKGKTMLMIAHRLSTILSADKIVMLEKGRVIAVGTHEQLLKDSREYRELVSKQLK